MMTERQIEAAFTSTRNLFVTGAAGTGKSYTLNQHIRKWEDAGLTVFKCAPTGLAAMNFEGGQTMHRLFGIPVPCYDIPHFGASNKKKKGYVKPSTVSTIANADVIVLDEVSMARNDAFQFMVRVIRAAEREKGAKIRLVVCGDFSQLPPVVKSTEEKILKSYGLDPCGFAFTTPEWKSMNFKLVELTEVKRQDDVEFIERLHEIRKGDFSHLSYWDRFVNPMPDMENAVVVCGTNTEADRINQEYLENLPGRVEYLEATSSGFIQASYVDKLIKVKVGAKVIFTANDSDNPRQPRYRNGQMGVVDQVCKDCVWINIDFGDGDIRRTYVEQHAFRTSSYAMRAGKLVVTEDACTMQYPFKLGKAITIHKSQGQTFSNVVVNPQIFAPGQLYVALSRATGPEGFCLTAPLTPDQLIVDPNVRLFYKNGCKWNRKPPTKKSVTVKKATKRKTSTKKASAKKTSVKKPAANKSAVKKTSTKKATPTRKTTAKKAPTKRTVSAKSAPKKPRKEMFDPETNRYTGGKKASPKNHSAIRPAQKVAAPKRR